MSPFVLLPAGGPAAPACSPAVCATGTQYVCPQYWTAADANVVWNASTNRWDLFQSAGGDHFWVITATGWESGLRPTSIDFVFNLGANNFWSFDLSDSNGNNIFSSAASIGPGLVTHNELCTFTEPFDIGNGDPGPPVHALKLGCLGSDPGAELVSICFRPV